MSQTAQAAPVAADKRKRRVALDEVVVEAKKPLSAASSDEIRAQDYELRPHATTQEILSNVPGLVVAQHQGGGKAPQYLVSQPRLAASVRGYPGRVTAEQQSGFTAIRRLVRDDRPG